MFGRKAHYHSLEKIIWQLSSKRNSSTVKMGGLRETYAKIEGG